MKKYKQSRIWLSISIIGIVLASMVLPLLTPMSVAAAAPTTPTNVSPVNGATDISLTWTLRSSAFFDPDVGDTHADSQWQISTVPGDYTSPIFDSGVDLINKISLPIEEGTLNYSTTYYWHVRHQDDKGEWSSWSTETSFTTIASAAPGTPTNVSPINGATDISLAWTLQSSDFADGSGAVHYASQWQIRKDGTPANFSQTIFNSGISTINKTSLIIPDGTLSMSTKYYWRVIYQNDRGEWSAWSAGTSFTTIGDVTAPVISTVVSSSISDTVAAITWTTDELATSQVEYGTTSTTHGNYDFSTAIDSNLVTSHGVALSGLTISTIYYYRVISKDASGNETVSAENTFTTIAAPDITAPVISAEAESSVTSSAAVITWTTDEAATSRIEYGITTSTHGSYDFITALISNLVTSHSVTLSGLAYSKTYYYRVISKDASGNERVSSEGTFDTAAPVIPMKPINGIPVQESTDISLTPTLGGSDFFSPDAEATHYATQWQISTTSGVYTVPSKIYDNTIYSAVTQIAISSGILKYSTTYYWHVRYQDSYGNWSAWSTETSFTTVGDTTSPVITGVASSSISDTTAAITWTTDEPTDSQVEYGTTTAYGSATVLAAALVNSHGVALSGLSASTTYHYRVKSKDASGNESISADFTFTTIATPDTTAPVISSVTSSGITSSTAVISWTTDEAATSRVEYGISIAYDAIPALDAIMIKNHIVTLSGLSPNTTYHYVVKSKDISDNEGATTDNIFTTMASGASITPVNISPADGTVDIILDPILRSSAFSDPDADDSHIASRWQIRTDSAAYDNPIFDSSVSKSSLTQIGIPSRYLKYDNTYYWHVKYQDSYGNWSNWSTETSFSTVATLSPNRPANNSPVNNASGISMTPTLRSSEFSDYDEGDSHAASQWQATTTPGNYSSPIYDSGTNINNLTEITVPSGKLSFDGKYYWRVRYQDSYGNWSAYSEETSFSTIVVRAPRQPAASSPSDKASGVSLIPVLKSSAFSDPDSGDTHAASQWQISATPGNFSSPIYDSGTDTSNKISITIPSGKLIFITLYYWHVRYQDSYGKWSDYSPEISFTTQGLQADFAASVTQAAPAETITFTDLSPSGITSWEWDFGDGITMEWAAENRPVTGVISHRYHAVGTYTVSLKITSPAGTNTKTVAGYITIAGPAGSGGEGSPMLLLGVVVVVVLGGGAGLLWYRRRRK